MLERLNVFKVEMKMKDGGGGGRFIGRYIFTIFDLQQLSMATEYSTLSVDLCEIPIHTQIRV